VAILKIVWLHKDYRSVVKLPLLLSNNFHINLHMFVPNSLCGILSKRHNNLGYPESDFYNLYVSQAGHMIICTETITGQIIRNFQLWCLWKEGDRCTRTSSVNHKTTERAKVEKWNLVRMSGSTSCHVTSSIISTICFVLFLSSIDSRRCRSALKNVLSSIGQVTCKT
jgi:hypothetical protein